MFKKFIKIEGISSQDFKQLLEILNSKELLNDVEKNYEHYIKIKKLKFLMKHNPKKEYFFCDDGLVDNLNLTFYKHILERDKMEKIQNYGNAYPYLVSFLHSMNHHETACIKIDTLDALEELMYYLISNENKNEKFIDLGYYAFNSNIEKKFDRLNFTKFKIIENEMLYELGYRKKEPYLSDKDRYSKWLSSIYYSTIFNFASNDLNRNSYLLLTKIIKDDHTFYRSEWVYRDKLEKLENFENYKRFTLCENKEFNSYDLSDKTLYEEEYSSSLLKCHKISYEGALLKMKNTNFMEYIKEGEKYAISR